MRDTDAEGTRVGSLNAVPAAEVFESPAAATGQSFDRGEPIPFFLHNVLGIDTGSGFKLRDPLAVLERTRADVDRALERYLPKPPACPALLAEAMRYSVFAGGKRLRPILTPTGHGLLASFTLAR